METYTLDEIVIRTDLNTGDIGYITFLHGTLYKEEYNYGVAFESYVASGLHEFYQQYDARTNRVWICEHRGKIIGSLFLMNRGKAAQLRYFLIMPDYRGIGLGNKLMSLFMEFSHHCQYESAYLWTTAELYAAAHLYKKFGFQLAEEKDSEAFEKPVQENKYVVYFK
jgi:N-acetylglutamate synthase-like GNAT family acetyltransferase